MASSAAASQIVVVLGAGPGLGYSCAQVFAKAGHPVALLSRSLPSLQELAGNIKKEHNDESRARAYAVDAGKKSDIEKAFKQIQEDWKGKAKVHTAIFNPAGGFLIKPFLETTEEDLKNALDIQTYGGFHFAQSFIRTVQSNGKTENGDNAIGNLLVTGATASVRGGAKFSAFAASKNALRAMTESIAREFGPQGIHAAHFIIDGIIDGPRARSWMGDKFEPHSRLDPNAIAQIYYDTTRQKRNAWTFQMDVRPGPESFS